MRLFLILTCYLGVAVAIITAGVIGASVLTSPVETATAEAQRPKLQRKAERSPGEQQSTEAPQAGGAFRYGPDVNHGRGDTPVNYSQQALREAKSGSSSSSSPVRQRRQLYQERRVVDPGVAMGFAPSVRPSGH